MVLYSKTVYFLILLLFSGLQLLAQEKNPVATFNGGEITLQEFVERYNFTPQIDDRVFAQDSGKYQFLASLIAEKLWASEAEKYGLTQDENYQGYISVLRNMFLRDALFKAEIERKVPITQEDYRRAEQKSKKIVTVIAIIEKDSSAIYEIYRKLEVEKIFFDSLFLSQPDTVSKNMFALRFGDLLDESIEDVVFSTKMGNYTRPLKDGDFWHIFKILRVDTDNSEPKDPQKSYKNRLKQRRYRVFGEQYLERIIGTSRIPLDNNIVNTLVIEMKKALESKYRNASGDSTLILTEKDIYSLRNTKLQQYLKSDVILFENNPLTLQYVLDYFAFHGFEIKASLVPNTLKEVVKILHRITEEELIAREALRSIPGISDTVESQLSIWKSNALAQLLRNRYLDSVQVSDDEVEQYYQKMNTSGEAVGKAQVSVLFVKDINIITGIFDSLKAGVSFSVLSERFEQSKYKTSTLMPFEHFSPFSDIIEKTEVGKIVGPLQGDSGYYLFKILKKKEADSVFLRPFASVKNDLELLLKHKKSEDLMNKRTKEFAVRYSLKVNKQFLNSVKGRTIPMYVYRFIGFGGRITASPFSSPMYKWIREFEKSNDLTP